MLNFLSRRTMKGEKATAKTSLLESWSPGGFLRATLRFFQFVMAVVVIGLYAQDLRKAQQQGKYADAKWVYAVFVGSLSAFLALVFALPLVKSWMFFYLDALVCFFWVVVFGIFGRMYLPLKPDDDEAARDNSPGVVRMKRAAWIDMTNMLLWFFSAVYGAFVFWKWRKERTVFTGRAESHV
ncbi:uncharacterized protein EI97DRAFT_385984 [Westerdykella ornata]|uniref:MARVEL domain-containing protein n=1 Tax=Westerdykella ornata TaxID=318751 RepID=A0A6A6J735_WESOR|nr:uncharacterized protein EI97DRAFT_385984 [Westerdykella ornata]KAF2272391.1 hypothetical protein EI97DRAFT_385984 [Westerdykella ornata]